MTADEIRAVEFPATIHMRGNKQRFEMLREIAAQLADLNSNLNTFVKQQLELQLDFMRGDVR